MLSSIKIFLEQRAQQLHHHQGGAVILLVLAAFLILTLTSMMMFDAGVSARDKMEIQTAADTAAYSQAVIKARSMNMIAYTNTAKRVFYGYLYTYFAAWQALLASWAAYAARCFRIFPHIPSCIRWGVGLVQIIMQGIELVVTHFSLMRRMRDEVENLENYQVYMQGITPWWSYAENLVRGSYNGATVTAAWPAPSATIPTDIIAPVVSAVSFIDGLFGTSFVQDYIPDFGLQTDDKLPLQKRGGIMGSAHLGYCIEFLGTPEHIMPLAEHIMQSDSGMKGISRDGQTLGILAGLAIAGMQNCIIASVILGDNVLDYTVGGLQQLGEAEWMQRTSNITIAYQAANYRTHNREQMDGLLIDHAERAFFKADGYWSMARSEFVYSDSVIAQHGNGLIPGIGSIGSRFSQGLVGGIMHRPNMWAPHWTARLRPMHLPGESLGTSAHGKDIGMIPILLDVAPYIAVTGLVAGLLDSNFDVGSAIRDIMFLYLASAGYSGDNAVERLQGLAQ